MIRSLQTRSPMAIFLKWHTLALTLKCGSGGQTARWSFAALAIANKRKAGAHAEPSAKYYFVSQTLMVFMPVSASVRVLNVAGPTWTIVVVVGFLSTIVQRLVVVSCTT